jgi:importin subunit alpha-6/7
VSCFSTLLTHSSGRVVKEACWALSNITAGPPAHIQAIFDASLVPMLMELVNSDGDSAIAAEAMWVLSNATNGTKEQVQYLVNCGMIGAIQRNLHHTNPKFVLVALESLSTIFRTGQQLMRYSHVTENPYCIIFEQNSGIDMLEALQTHKNGEIYSTVVTIIETFFGVDDSDGV